MDLKELRKSKGLSQHDAATLIGIPFRTYQNYEYGLSKAASFKGRAILKALTDYAPYSEMTGVYSREDLVTIIKEVAKAYLSSDIDFLYLFGSYAKMKATEKSDIDLLLSGKLTGLAFFGFQGKLEKALHKKVDFVRFQDLAGNPSFCQEILKTGVRIYG
jgi:predicted nucleotidyltransferase